LVKALQRHGILAEMCLREESRCWCKMVEFHGGSFARVLNGVLIRVPSETAAAKTRNSMETTDQYEHARPLVRRYRLSVTLSSLNQEKFTRLVVESTSHVDSREDLDKGLCAYQSDLGLTSIPFACPKTCLFGYQSARTRDLDIPLSMDDG
jgi:hypothetical protein